MWNKTDWTSFEKTLDKHLKINSTITTPQELDREVDNFTSAVDAVDTTHCKSYTLNSYRDLQSLNLCLGNEESGRNVNE